MSKIPKGLLALALALGLGLLGAFIAAPVPEASATMCFKTGEQISGMNKICYYNCLGSTYAITIRSTELCPLSINR